MIDQAAKLRKLINDKKTASGQTVLQNEQIVEDARVICVTSGKGGVGKTNFTINLAIELSRLNNRVVIMDADLGLANVDVALGIIPEHTLLDVIHGEKSIGEVMSPGPDNIKVISGGSGITELVDMSFSSIQQLTEKLLFINNYADIILIDTGAGLSSAVLSFVLAAQEVIVVTTSEPTSITDAYAMIKTINSRKKNKEIGIVINRVKNITEGDIAFEKLKNAAKRFLSMDLYKLGYVFEDNNVVKSVKKQVPFIIGYPNSIATKNIKDIAIGLIDDKGVNMKSSRNLDSFFKRIFGFFRQEA